MWLCIDPQIYSEKTLLKLIKSFGSPPAMWKPSDIIIIFAPPVNSIHFNASLDYTLITENT